MIAEAEGAVLPRLKGATDGKPADFLLVIPSYREHFRLPPFLRDLVTVLGSASFTTEILVVDDGSPEQEQRALCQAIEVGSFGACRISPPLLFPVNRGKGHAILAGWRSREAARWLAFVDADGAIPAREVLRVFGIASNLREDRQGPCLFGSRMRMPERTVRNRFARHVSGRAFATFANLLVGSRVEDTQCGFKLIPQQVFQRVSPLLEEPGFCFDIELILALEHVRTNRQIVPIDWEHKAGGHVHVFRDGMRMLLRLPTLHLRKRRWKNGDRG